MSFNKKENVSLSDHAERFSELSGQVQESVMNVEEFDVCGEITMRHVRFLYCFIQDMRTIATSVSTKQGLIERALQGEPKNVVYTTKNILELRKRVIKLRDKLAEWVSIESRIRESAQGLYAVQEPEASPTAYNEEMSALGLYFFSLRQELSSLMAEEVDAHDEDLRSLRVKYIESRGNEIQKESEYLRLQLLLLLRRKLEQTAQDDLSRSKHVQLHNVRKQTEYVDSTMIELEGLETKIPFCDSSFPFAKRELLLITGGAGNEALAVCQKVLTKAQAFLGNNSDHVG